jgi:hypothetical protein
MVYEDSDARLTLGHAEAMKKKSQGCADPARLYRGEVSRGTKAIRFT